MVDDQMRALIEDKIKDLHSGDERQLEVILNSYDKLIVEAPAGYGKTKTMISKIAYILASNQLPNPKKILALTFSVNAAYKIKKDVSEQLPVLMSIKGYFPVKVNEKVHVSNYHGFCRHILRRYGYLLHENLRNIDSFKSVDDSDVQYLVNLNLGISVTEAEKITHFNQAVRGINQKYMQENWNYYVNFVKEKFISNNYIPYNAILILALELLASNSNLLKFYQDFFPIIIVDEFQDTNILSWHLLYRLISPKTKIIFMGDSLQRIYGFIGAIPNLLSYAEKTYEMKKVALSKNYRFKDNPQMLLLDRNIRLNAENPENPNVNETADIPFQLFESQEQEAHWISTKIQEISSSNSGIKIAILTKQRGRNVNVIINSLIKNNIDYFYGLFSDDDAEYINFHRVCSREFSEQIKGDRRISKVTLGNLLNKVKDLYKAESNPVIISLIDLLDVFLTRIVSEYSFLSIDDKIIFIFDTFENNALKQNMEYVNKNVILSTVHGAKGLEWSYVILPDMEQYVFPNYMGLCGACNSRNVVGDKCILKYSKLL